MIDVTNNRKNNYGVCLYLFWCQLRKAHVQIIRIHVRKMHAQIQAQYNLIVSKMQRMLVGGILTV